MKRNMQAPIITKLNDLSKDERIGNETMFSRTKNVRGVSVGRTNTNNHHK